MKTRGALRADASLSTEANVTRGSSAGGKKKATATPVVVEEKNDVRQKNEEQTRSDKRKGNMKSEKKGVNVRGEGEGEEKTAQETKEKKGLKKKEKKVSDKEDTSTAWHMPEPDPDWGKKWDAEMKRQKEAVQTLEERILQHVIRNDALPLQTKREMNADTTQVIAPTDARWEPYLLLMGATLVETKHDIPTSKPKKKKSVDETASKSKPSEWQGVPRWKAAAWKRQRNYFKIGESFNAQVGRQAPGLRSGTESISGGTENVKIGTSLASHPVLRASYFGIEYREWYALLLAVCPFPPRPEILEWLVTQRIPLEWHEWSRAIETREGESEMWNYLTTDDLDSAWTSRCILALQTHLLKAPGWDLEHIYTVYLNSRLKYDKVEIPEIYLLAKETTLSAIKSGDVPNCISVCDIATSTSAYNCFIASKSEAVAQVETKDYAEESGVGLAQKMVPCTCRWGDIVVVGKETGKAYVVDERGVCISFVSNDRESDSIGMQLPPSFKVPRPFPVRYWVVSNVAPYRESCAGKRYRFEISDWLDTLQPREFVVNFDADPKHYAGEVVFRNMKETQAGKVPWLKADDYGWWLLSTMDSDIDADGKNAYNSRIQWATLTFPLGADPGTGHPNLLTVYVWQRGTKRVTEEACWEAVRDQENLLELMPTGGIRLRAPTPTEVLRLHESDGA
jgi:hypothetical protein